MPSGRTPANKRTRGRGRTADLPRLLGGRLCLDFANTIEGPISAEPEDFLRDFASLARWSWHARAIDDAEAARLQDLAQANPARADQIFAAALRLRQSLDRIFRAVAAGREPMEDDLQTVNAEHLEALGAATLALDGRRFGWTWRGADDPRLPVWLAVASAIEILTEGDLARVKQCPGADDCGWLFYDTSRNRTRRWCSMEGCGSRVKMRRHYARHNPRAHQRVLDR